MEEAVTRKFVHEESGIVITLSGQFEILSVFAIVYPPVSEVKIG